MENARNWPDSLDKKEYDELRKLYNQAIKEKKTQFTFQDHPMLVSYVKYVLEYLEPKFKNMK